jgi:hypothetical protein
MGVTKEEIVVRYPRLYHMAEANTWESIKRYGLMSTSTLLDFFEINGAKRKAIESAHRPESVKITHPQYGTAVIRDQKPMNDKDLTKCLKDGLTPRQWYENLNQYVFFWLTRERLLTLLKARAYRDQQHCVLTVETAPMLEKYADQVMLTAMNSGNTKPFPHPRGNATFLPLDKFPFQERSKTGNKQNAIVEFAVKSAVPDISDFVIKVDHMIGDRIIENIFER